MKNSHPNLRKHAPYSLQSTGAQEPGWSFRSGKGKRGSEAVLVHLSGKPSELHVHKSETTASVFSHQNDVFLHAPAFCLQSSSHQHSPRTGPLTPVQPAPQKKSAVMILSQHGQMTKILGQAPASVPLGVKASLNPSRPWGGRLYHTPLYRAPQSDSGQP